MEHVTKKLNKKDILIRLYNEMLEKLVRNEVDEAFFTSLSIIVKDGQEAVKVQQELAARKLAVRDITMIVNKINEKIEAEEKKVN